jgi:YidC/Oxa1 family membrane protein insertase
MPFKWLLLGLNALTHNYGIALMLFAVVVNIVFTPFYGKSKRGTLRMQRLQPQVDEIKRKYPTDQQKQSAEMAKLYKSEKVSMTGGCVWMLIPLIIMFMVYSLLRMPFTKLFGLTVEQFAYMRDNIFPIVGMQPASGNNFYEEIHFAHFMHSNFDTVLRSLSASSNPLMADAYHTLSKLSPQDMNFTLIGLNLSDSPSWKIWESGWTWSAIGLFLLPVFSAGISLTQSLIQQKMNPPAKADGQASTMKGMMFMGPVMSLVIGYSMPALMSIYWGAGGVLSLVRDVFQTRYYKRQIDAEFAVKDAERAARDADIESKRVETERLKSEGKLIENPNVSEEKRKQQEKRDRELRQRQWDQAHGVRKKDEASNPSQIGDRQYARGRNYDPNRYRRNGGSHAAQEELENEAV